MIILTTGCLGPVKELYPENEQQRPVPVYLIKLGWHVGIAFDGTHLREELPPNKRIPEGQFLMVGWGDNKYYPADKAGVWLFLRAALLPTGSVIHMVGFEPDVDRYFKSREVVRIQLSDEGMKNMTEYIVRQFRKGEEGGLIYTADGLYANSAFFKSRGIYIFPHTSNKWTARVLRKSGFPITPFYAITSGNVMHQVKKEGEVLGR